VNCEENFVSVASGLGLVSYGGHDDDSDQEAKVSDGESPRSATHSNVRPDLANRLNPWSSTRHFKFSHALENANNSF